MYRENPVFLLKKTEGFSNHDIVGRWIRVITGTERDVSKSANLKRTR